MTEIDSKVLLILDSAELGLTNISGDKNICSILLSNRPLVRLQSGTYKRHESKDLWRFFFQKFMREYKMHKY